MNLVLNSIDAVTERQESEGGSFIGQVHLAAELEGDDIVLRVRDNGGGIPQDAVEEIFEPFFTTKEQGKGTGLGLSVALGIAQVHGGTLEVQSEANQSSEFIARFPTEDDNEDSSG